MSRDIGDWRTTTACFCRIKQHAPCACAVRVRAVRERTTWHCHTAGIVVVGNAQDHTPTLGIAGGVRRPSVSQSLCQCLPDNGRWNNKAAVRGTQNAYRIDGGVCTKLIRRRCAAERVCVRMYCCQVDGLHMVNCRFHESSDGINFHWYTPQSQQQQQQQKSRGCFVLRYGVSMSNVCAPHAGCSGFQRIRLLVIL